MGKIVITGTGRCGTSFLMHLFTALGCNTGYSPEECEQHLSRSGCNGGIEHSVGTELFDKSDIVKNPLWMYEPELLDGVDIDAVIVPIRDLNAVAKSREKMGVGEYGGFWRGAKTVDEQMKIDAKSFHKFITYAAKNELKMCFLDFSNSLNDKYYLYSMLYQYFEGEFMEFSEIEHAFDKISNPNLIHF